MKYYSKPVIDIKRSVFNFLDFPSVTQQTQGNALIKSISSDGIPYNGPQGTPYYRAGAKISNTAASSRCAGDYTNWNAAGKRIPVSTINFDAEIVPIHPQILCQEIK